MVPISHYLLLAAALFAVGVVGVLVRRNALVVLMSIELMLNAANLTFIAFSKYHGNDTGQIAVFFVIAVAAAEAAVGLAIVLALFRRKRSVALDQADLLKH